MPSCSPQQVVSRNVMQLEKSAQGNRRAKHKMYCLIDDPLVILSTSKAFCNFCSRGGEIIGATDPSKIVDTITIKDQVADSLCQIFLTRQYTL